MSDGSGERWIVIPNWDDFQHYKDRDPRWIKNYIRLLADRNYLKLSSRQRGILHGIWMLYAASGRDLGASPARLGRMLGDSTVRTRDLESLNHAGFITLSASPEKNRERIEKKGLLLEGTNGSVSESEKPSPENVRTLIEEALG